MPEQRLPPEIPPEFAERARLITQLSRMIGSVWVPHAIHAAAVLGIPDLLAGSPKRSEELAEAAGADADALHRFLRALVALELCSQRDDGAFEITPLGACLRSGTRDSLRSWALVSGSERMMRSWGRLVDCVRTGDSAPKLLDGVENPFDYFAGHPAEAAVFDQFMVEVTRQLAGAIALSYDFSEIRLLVDIGGGYGALLPAILTAYPDMRGVVVDLPRCRDGAIRLFENTRLSERCEIVAGSAFDSVPAGADAYVLKNVIHGLADQPSRVILRNCRAAMREDSRLLLIEAIVPEQPGSSPLDQMITGSDLNMLVNAGGRERTESQYRHLLEAAALRLARIVPTPVGMSVIEARPM